MTKRLTLDLVIHLIDFKLRLMPVDQTAARDLKQRTLTILHSERPTISRIVAWTRGSSGPTADRQS